jgi:glycosyltransferase involved in cell wall biosynthesis
MAKIGNQPKVSVIIPVYQGERYIADCIRSIIKQTYKNIEILVMDDCSSDNTASIIFELKSIDERIKYIRNSKNLGYAGNRNLAIKIVKNDLICWQDADDIARPNRVELQVKAILKNDSIGMVGGAMEIFDNHKIYGIRKYPINDDQIRKMIYKFSPIALPASLIKKRVYEEVGLYRIDSGPACDLEMTFRIAKKYLLANIPEVVIGYRIHQNSGTIGHLRKIELDTIRTRWINRNHIKLRPSLGDYIYNITHLISIFIIPAGLKLWIFNKIRTS